MKWILLCICFLSYMGCNNKPASSDTKKQRYDKTKDFQSKNVESSEAFSNTSDFVGAEVFLAVDDNKDILVKITAIEFLKNKEGQLLVGKLVGKTTWGDDSIKGINYDVMERLMEEGCTKVNSFNGTTLVDSTLKPGIVADSVMFKKVTVNDHILLCPVYFKGKRLTGSPILLSVQSLFCVGVLKYDCVNALICAGRCPMIRTDDWFISTCNCPSGGACYLRPSGTDCITISCPTVCNNLTGWASLCPCF